MEFHGNGVGLLTPLSWSWNFGRTHFVLTCVKQGEVKNVYDGSVGG